MPETYLFDLAFPLEKPSCPMALWGNGLFHGVCCQTLIDCCTSKLGLPRDIHTIEIWLIEWRHAIISSSSFRIWMDICAMNSGRAVLVLYSFFLSQLNSVKSHSTCIKYSGLITKPSVTPRCEGKGWKPPVTSLWQYWGLHIMMKVSWHHQCGNFVLLLEHLQMNRYHAYFPSDSTIFNSINQSNFYSTNIPGKAWLSGTAAKSVFNNKIEETVP